MVEGYLDNGTCAIWGTPAKVWRGAALLQSYESLRAGGRHAIFADMPLPSMDDGKRIRITNWLVSERLKGDPCPIIHMDNIATALSTPTLSTSERVRRFFIYCSIYRNRIGDKVFIRDYCSSIGLSESYDRKSSEDDLLYAFAEVNSNDDTHHFIKYLMSTGYIDSYYELTPKAFERIDVLVNTNKDSKKAFVAMWFDSSLNDVYANGIEPAIIEAGYEPRIIRNVEHNNKIDDEIIAEIRRSKFVIADFTCGFSEDKQPIARGGVYYEAGFAQGLGLPVIWTCRSDIINHVHFDTRQYNHIVWDTPDDLKIKLLNRIRATIT